MSCPLKGEYGIDSQGICGTETDTPKMGLSFSSCHAILSKESRALMATD